MEYLSFFGFKQNPFPSNLKAKELLITDQLKHWHARFEFVTTHKLWGVLTGEVGAGKSTAVRWAMEQLSQPQFKPILITATNGTFLEVLRKILFALGHMNVAGIRAKMIHAIRQSFLDIHSQKITPVLIIDEASLLPLDVFRELHTLSQFDCDSKPVICVVLVGQEDLIDKLSYPTSRSLASRITARMHLTAGDMNQTSEYVRHHLKLAGGKETFFDEHAFTAIHQASGGLLRTINNLARCSLISAAAQKRQVVSADDIQVASSEMFLNS